MSHGSGLRSSLAIRGHRAREVLGRAHARVGSALGLGSVIRLDYPPHRSGLPRYGHGRPPHGRLTAIVGQHRAAYGSQLARFLQYSADLAAITPDPEDRQAPEWVNEFLPGMDAVALYGLIRERKPARYVEVGSGHSTKFAARAIRDGGLATTITSIDPAPRAEVAGICDLVLRASLEDVDLGLFAELEAGDILFCDGSHRVFTNSDATVFFIDVLPALRPGVLVGIHDVYLPADYPADVASRYYSEQYLLAAYLLSGGSRIRPVLACAYASEDPTLREILLPLWPAVTSGAAVETHGVAFWFDIAGRSAAGGVRAERPRAQEPPTPQY